MDSTEAVPDNSLYHHQHGISGWMKSFGRLGNTTDFEKYGSSPPESDNTFFDYKMKHNNIDAKEHFLTSSAEEIPVQKFHEGSLSNSFLYDPQLNNGMEQSHSHLPVPSLSSILLESFTDDTSSSTDTTPFVTPQGSPLIPRRNTIESVHHHSLAKDLAAQNTRKWLYKGFVAEGNEKVPTTIPKKRIKQPGNISPTSKEKKCNISNFDINAISPTSW